MIREGFLKNVDIKEEIGKGNYGKVYLLEKNNEKEAMKVIEILPENSEENLIKNISNSVELEDKITKIMNEVNILYSLKGNTHIVNYLDHYVEKTENKYTLYLEMEYLHTLQNQYGNEINTKTTMKILYDILDALTICEENHIIHGDIKPQNIMVDEKGNHKLADFGIAKIYDSQAIINESTKIYASPEVINEKKYTKQSDLYSLGLVIYQLFNNNLLPYMKNTKIITEKDKRLMIEKRMNKEIPRPKGIDNEMYNFLKKALQPNPKDRYQSALEMKHQLQYLDENNHIPEKTISIVLLESIALKLSVTTVNAVVETAGILSVIHSMSVATKIILGLCTVLVFGGGTYAIASHPQRNIEENEVVLNTEEVKNNLSMYEGLNPIETYEKATEYFNKNIHYYVKNEKDEIHMGTPDGSEELITNYTISEKYNIDGKRSQIDYYKGDEFSTYASVLDDSHYLVVDHDWETSQLREEPFDGSLEEYADYDENLQIQLQEIQKNYYKSIYEIDEYNPYGDPCSSEYITNSAKEENNNEITITIEFAKNMDGYLIQSTHKYYINQEGFIYKEVVDIIGTYEEENYSNRFNNIIVNTDMNNKSSFDYAKESQKVKAYVGKEASQLEQYISHHIVLDK